VTDVTFVSTNPGKFGEVRELLREFGIAVRWKRRELPEPQADRLEDVLAAKLDAVADVRGCVLVEDSGLFIPSLGGFPGVYSAHFLRIWKFDPIFELLRRRPRGAYYRAIAGLRVGRRTWTFAGEVRGAIAAYTGLPAVADDSGLCVDALHGMPGVFSARWAGKHGDDRANLDLVLGQLSDVAARGAQFVCVAALVLPPVPETPDGTRREWTTTGVLAGELTRAPRGSNGFGYDPIFVPRGWDRTFAEGTAEEKNAVSHRARAIRQVGEHLVHGRRA
jgi:non-canonical purine NTP pyrophosphatase (RdgB/HAM1 family)